MTEPRPEPDASAEELIEEVDPERDVVAEAARLSSDPPGGGQRSRRVLAAAFWLLASAAVLFGGLAVWAHQTLLTSDGWGGIAEDLISQEDVTEAMSVVLVDRLSGSLGVQELVSDLIPGPEIVSRAVSGVVQDRVTEAVADFAASDAFQRAFVSVNKAAHDAALTAIRGGDSEALTSESGVLSFNLLPLIEGLLNGLQDAGLLSEDRQIPDLSDYEATPRAIALVENVLGRDIDDDVGTIVLIDSQNLETVQTAVRWFDLITVVLLLLWVGFTALALWFAQRRARMVLWLSMGAVAALLAGRFMTRLILEGVTRRQPELEARVVVSAFLDAAVDSLMWFTFVLMAVAVIVAIASVLWERRDQMQRPSMETPPRTLGRWVKGHMLAILAVGTGVIAIVALWSVGGPGIALLVASALLLLGIAVKVLADQADADEPGAGAHGNSA